MLENTLDYIRIALYVLLLALGFLLIQAWNQDHPQSLTTAPVTATVTATNVSNHFVPEVAAPQEALPLLANSPTSLPQPTTAKGEKIKIMTDVLDVVIDTDGGDIVEAKFLQYPESLNSKIPFVLLNNDPKTRYLAESGLLSKQGPDTSQEKAVYTSSQTQYQLSPNENTLLVTLNWQNQDGLHVTKIFSFTRSSYEIKVSYEIDNQAQGPWEGNLYTQLMRTDMPPPSQGGLVNLATYFGTAISSPAKAFEKMTFKEMREKNLNRSVSGGWIAMLQHYFISAWVPDKDTTATFYSQVNTNGLYTIGMLGQPLQVAPGTKALTQATLYTGPAVAEQLEKAAPSLKLTIDFGWFWFISGIIFWMMQKIYDVIGNWGWSIVLVTILIKLLFYHLSAKSYRSMSAMKKLQPRIEMLKERHGDDKQKLTQATLELYRQEKVNPMSGCLPILIQIPVFIALYWVLVESVELRQAPFILWIHDLSQADPYYILPVLMGISMFFQQRLNPPPPDPLQAKIMMLMPIVFTVLFANFPSGLMLYWFVNTTLSFLQQWYIMHNVNKEPVVVKKAK
jgi:YidC/Oxa1 family membrane protein insertase